MPDNIFASNTEIDAAIIESISSAPRTSVSIASFLVDRFGGRLRQVRSKYSTRLQHPLQNAGEIANQACQRLKRKGLVTFSHKSGWQHKPAIH